jgi:ADP-ribose pyrophosphatase YjhB (NUDIX family)
MADSMIMFDKGDARFVLCVRGISIYRDRLLAFTAEGVGMDCWALPGGRVDMLEKSEDTLIREMQEELGTDVKVGRLVWVVENFFKERDRSYHEIGMYYLMTLPSNASILNSEEYSCMDGQAKLTFRWFPISELDNINLRPIFLRKGLQNIPLHTEHVIWCDY